MAQQNKTTVLNGIAWSVVYDSEDNFQYAVSQKSGNRIVDKGAWDNLINIAAQKSAAKTVVSSASSMMDAVQNESVSSVDSAVVLNDANAANAVSPNNKKLRTNVPPLTVTNAEGAILYYDSPQDAFYNGIASNQLTINFEDGSSMPYDEWASNSTDQSWNNLVANGLDEETTTIAPSLEFEGQQMYDPRLQISPQYVYGTDKSRPLIFNVNPFQHLQSMYFDYVGKVELGAVTPIYDALLKLKEGGDITYTIADGSALANGVSEEEATTETTIIAEWRKRFGDRIPSLDNIEQDYLPKDYASIINTDNLSENKGTNYIVMGDASPNSTASKIKDEQSLYGVNSLMNSYTFTRLVGSLDVEKDGSNTDTVRLKENRMFDVRDKKRFYDVNIYESDDVTSVLAPTTTNIIQLSNADRWGRTPYKFQDFVFCKYWNIIPNNRLITLRKYGAPTYDNLNFRGQEDKNQDNNPQQNTFAPIATVLSYFGGDTGNSLNALMSFTTGVNWTETNAGSLHDVTGDDGSNVNELIEDTLMSGTPFGHTTGMSAINSLLDGSGSLMTKFLSFDKFLGFFDQKGYSVEKANADKLFNQSKIDPYSNGPYENRIVGPVNRIDKVYKRKEGITFSQTLNVKCSYIARPIGNVNPKAALLDILGNALLIGSANAVFWGGGYRFMIKPSLDPFTDQYGRKNSLEQLYKGKIFGDDGGIATMFHGFTNAISGGENNNNFSASGLKSIFAQGAGFLGQVWNQTIGSLLGVESDGLLNMIPGLNEDKVEKGKEKADKFTDNVEKLWQSKVIQKTQYPNINGLHAILLGEPVGDLHLTVGNPLNPIMVIGNLICENMKVSFGEELGPDDFPLEMNIEYSLKHGMARDRAAIESMFNRGAGKIYDLPDYIKASSDYETKVDAYTGGKTGFRQGEYLNKVQLQLMAHKAADDDNMETVEGAAGTIYQSNGVPKTVGYNVSTVSKGTRLTNSGSADNLLNTKFTPINTYASRTKLESTANNYRKLLVPKIVFNSMHAKKVIT